MLPVQHNFNAIKGEVISLKIGYNNVVASENLFACVRKYANSEDYKAKFNIDVSYDDLQLNEACKIALFFRHKRFRNGQISMGFIHLGRRPPR